MALTLYAAANDFKAFKALAAAQYNDVKVTVVNVDPAKVPAAVAAAGGTIPLLVTPSGAISRSSAIARYLGKVRRDTELAGSTFFETAQVDSWLDFTSTELELPAALVVGPAFGTAQKDAVLEAEGKAKLVAALGTLEEHLLPRTYLVGEAITLADIACACALVQPFQVALDADARAPFPSVTRWFHTIVNQPAVARVVGAVDLSGTGEAPAAASGVAAGGGKKEKAPAAPKEEKKKEEKPKKKKEEEDDDGGGEDAAEAALRAEPKKVDPFAALPPSAFVMDEWKRTYSNGIKEEGGKAKVMEWFWANLDRAGYTVWRQNYKYNADNKTDWMVSNTVGGFMQRCDEVRKYAFGMMAVLGDKAPFEIMGIWLLRGKSMAPMLEANPDAEYYDWIEVNPEDAAVRANVMEVWTHDWPGKLEGKEIYDSKCFK